MWERRLTIDCLTGWRVLVVIELEFIVEFRWASWNLHRSELQRRETRGEYFLRVDVEDIESEAFAGFPCLLFFRCDRHECVPVVFVFGVL